MNSPIVVNINSKLKEKAMKMAKSEGLTMKALLSFLLKWYTEKEIEINATFSQHKRNSEIEISSLLDEEIKMINSNSILKNAPDELNKLLVAKWI